MTPAFELEGVSRWYGEVIGLNAVSASVAPGIVGILGPNGAGKTTLLRLLSGQIRPNLGRVRVLGMEPFANPALYRRLGLVPDVESVAQGLTGAEFLQAIARLHGWSGAEARRRADRALEQVGLGAAAARKAGGYSKGMRQRLKLAQAILHEPEVLILDEPLTGLDPLARHDISELVRGFAARGGSAVISSHILREVEALTRRVIVVYEGKLVAEGEIGEIRERIESEPRRVAIRSPGAKALAAELLAQPDVVGVALGDDGASVVVRTRAAAALFRRLPGLALELGVALEEVRADDEDLESVFRYLVRRP